MKKSTVWMLAALIGFAACDNNKDVEYDELGIYPIQSGHTIIYADQTVDSFTVVSVSSWKASVEGQNASLDPFKSSKSQSGAKIESHTCPIYFTPNTSSAIKYSLLKVKNNKHSVARSYLQTYWLDIKIPAVAFSGPTTKMVDSYYPGNFNPENQYKGAYFLQEIAKDSTSTLIIFNTYAQEATLTTDADWITPKELRLESGSHTVELSFQANETGKDRTAIYKLSSNGITNDITFVQKGK